MYSIQLSNGSNYESIIINMTWEQWNQFINDAITITLEPETDIKVKFNES